MANAEQDGLLRALFRQPRFGPAIWSALLAGVMMLFLDQWEPNVRLYLIPSIVVYSLGANLVGSLHRALALHYVQSGDVNNEKRIPKAWKLLLLGLHIAWFAALVAYNVYRLVF